MASRGRGRGSFPGSEKKIGGTGRQKTLICQRLEKKVGTKKEIRHFKAGEARRKLENRRLVNRLGVAGAVL